MNTWPALPRLSRRRFWKLSAAMCAWPAVKGAEPLPGEAEPIIDIHQHTNYSGRSNEQLVSHQRALGVTQTVLLPAGKLYGLAAQCGGNDSVVELADRYPLEYLHFANEVAYLPEACSVVETYLRRGAIGIGEQKFHVECDSKYIEHLAELAREYGVPILLHFQHQTYNLQFERFHKVLEKFPKVNFIGHAQTWWANIDQDHRDPAVLYPKTKVTPGGLTDRYLRDYPNMYGDLSAGSGLNALIRDEDHARDFLARHQDKLLYGSDCSDAIGRGPGCTGAQAIAAIRRLAPNKTAERKLLYLNAKRLLKI